jgi:hypothetical protein
VRTRADILRVAPVRFAEVAIECELRAGIFGHRIKVDATEGAVDGAKAETDEAVLVDLDGQRAVIGAPMDGVDRAFLQAERVVAGPAGPGHEEPVEPFPLKDQHDDPVMKIGAGLDAILATGASVEVENEQVLSLVESLPDVFREPVVAAPERADVLAHQGQRVPLHDLEDLGDILEHGEEGDPRDVDEFDMVAGPASRGPFSLRRNAAGEVVSRELGSHGEESDLAEMIARRQEVQMVGYPSRDRFGSFEAEFAVIAKCKVGRAGCSKTPLARCQASVKIENCNSFGH